MITASGKHIQKIGGAAGTPTASDIAIHSGRICRFGGAVWYPLLPHLLFVGAMAYNRSIKANPRATRKAWANLVWGCLHDAHEVVTCDVPRPFKCDCMREEQKALDGRIADAFMSVDLQMKINPELIKECDRDAADIEAVQLKLPGYAECETADPATYGRNRRRIYAGAEDVELFKKIYGSVFMKNTIAKGSVGVMLFTGMLESFKENTGIAKILFRSYLDLKV